MHAGLGRAEFGEDVAALVADEAVAVETLAASVPIRLAATTGTTFETAWPIIARRHSRLVSRSGSCGSVPIAVGKKQDLGAHQHQRARRFRIPLVPADADAERRRRGVGQVLKPVLPGRK